MPHIVAGTPESLGLDPMELSDNFHSFRELYNQRAVLFAVLVRNYPGTAWKARRHFDGTKYDGHFICGITTHSGDATFHFEDARWDLFKCQEYDCAPNPYDGATSEDVLDRLMTLI